MIMTFLDWKDQVEQRLLDLTGTFNRISDDFDLLMCFSYNDGDDPQDFAKWFLSFDGHLDSKINFVPNEEEEEEEYNV
jgi:hypothetical protein